jgi:ABC-type multidrug transport system fused ATPase/permease subunit
LDRGYDCVLGQQQNNLSGGERQRIAISRELLREPKILIIDEATSQLDSLTEKAIIELIINEFPHTTCLIVSHRLSATADCDLIVVMNHGRIVKIGNHTTLMQTCDLYANLFEAQNRMAANSTGRNGMLSGEAAMQV